MNTTIEQFIGLLQNSLADHSFVKLTLGHYKGADEHLQKIFIRLVETKQGPKLMFQFRASTRDTVKNYPIADAPARIREFLGSGFRSAHLFTTAGDHQLTIGKRSAKIISGKPAFSSLPDAAHDRLKHHRVDPNAYYLKALGVATDDGKIKADQRDKWKQINKFVEVLDGLYENSGLKGKTGLKIVDLGSGKGYLTFAAYDHFSKKLDGDPAVSMTGVELRPDLVALGNEVAQAGGFEGLGFVQGSIADFDAGDADIFIALHACDTATDDALFRGIKANASIIVAAPCCHHEIKAQMRPPDMLAGILRHPVLHERTAETITDGIRSLMLEAHGYKTKMFEFVATEHTPKNNLLVAIKQNKIADVSHIEHQIDEILDTFGIAQQRLHALFDET